MTPEEASAAPLMVHPHPEPRPYHLMLRTWTYRPGHDWWRPVAGIVLSFAAVVLVLPFLMLPVLIVGVLIEGGTVDFWDRFLDQGLMTDLTPSGLLYLNLTIAGMAPVTWLVVRYLHRLRPRWLSSVKPGMRWTFLLGCLGLAVVALISSLVVGAFLPVSVDPSGNTELNDFTLTTVALALVVVFTTPLQAIGEEYLFRGYLLQSLGALFRVEWVAITVSALIFAAAHGAQNFPLFFDRFGFGIVAAWLVIRTGGLEAGIALHILNNVVAFGLAILVGDIGESMTVSEASWWNIPVTLTQSIVFAVLVLWWAKRAGIARMTAPPIGAPISGFDVAGPVAPATT